MLFLVLLLYNVKLKSLQRLAYKLKRTTLKYRQCITAAVDIICFVLQVKYKALVRVDEEGTEAAAVTVTGNGRRCCMAPLHGARGNVL